MSNPHRMDTLIDEARAAAANLMVLDTGMR
jgi:hypothetical protein